MSPPQTELSTDYGEVAPVPITASHVVPTNVPTSETKVGGQLEHDTKLQHNLEPMAETHSREEAMTKEFPGASSPPVCRSMRISRPFVRLQDFTTYIVSHPRPCQL